MSTNDPKTRTSPGEAAGFAVTTNEADNPFGLGLRLRGASAIADRSAVLLTADVNLAEGGRLVLQPSRGNVGIGTYTPQSDNKLEVNGTIAATSLNVDSATMKGLTALSTLTVAKDTTVTGPMKINGKNVLEFGAGVSDKQIDAGKIGYQVWSTNSLDIVGAGNKADASDRKIKFFAEGGATLAGSLSVTGAVDGNMKVVYQRDDEPQKTNVKPLSRYHMSLTAAKYAGRTKSIPNNILAAMCGTPDGCEVRLGMTRWDDVNKTQTASVSNQLYLGNNGRWRVSWPRDTEGVIGNGKTEEAMNAWNTCILLSSRQLGRHRNWIASSDAGSSACLLSS